MDRFTAAEPRIQLRRSERWRTIFVPETPRDADGDGALLTEGKLVAMVDQDTPLESFRSFTTLHLHLAARAMERFGEVYYRRQFGMKVAECRVIGITASHGIASFRQICDEGAFEKSYASRLINTLHVRGLVDKKWSEVDQRTVYLSLTGAGRALHRRLHAAAAEINQRWLAAIPAAERVATLRNLELLTVSARNLEEQMREPEPPDELVPATAS